MLPGFLPILRLLLFAGKPSMQFLQPLFCFPQVARVGYRVPIAIGEKFLQAHINTGMFASGNMFYASFSLYSELTEIAISTLDEANALDLLLGKRFDALFLVPHKPQAPDTAAIGEGDVLPIGFQLPASLLVVHGTIIVLETGIALLAWLVVLAVLIEASNGKPCSLSRGLTCLGVETSSKGIRTSEDSAIALEIVLADPMPIHPEAQSLITNVLHHSYCR